MDCPKLPKPLLKGLHMKQTFKNLLFAMGYSFTVTMLVYIFVNRTKRETYRQFYLDYDADAAFERMKEAGIFQSTGPASKK